MYSTCKQMRRMLVTHSVLSMRTGESREIGKEWETRACGAPLSGEVQRTRGTCTSCTSGWTHEHNYPIADTAS